MDSLISTFHIDWKIILAQAINFAIVFAILYKFALKPLSKLMADRSDKIEKGITDAKMNAELRQRAESEYNEAIQKAKAEANNIFQEGKKEAEMKRTEMLENAKNEVAVLIENGKRMLESEKVKMVEDAKKEVVALVVKATEKLVGTKVDAAFDARVVEELKNLK